MNEDPTRSSSTVTRRAALATLGAAVAAEHAGPYVLQDELAAVRGDGD